MVISEDTEVVDVVECELPSRARLKLINCRQTSVCLCYAQLIQLV